MRKRKPAQISRAEPSRMNGQKPKLPTGCPEPPIELSEEQMLYYAYFGEQFEKMKIITQVDREALVTIAQLMVQRDYCTADIKEHGYFYKVRGRNGEQKKKNPAIDVLSETRRQIRAWFVEFGLTPASREKVKTGEGTQGDLFGDFLQNKPQMKAIK